jgi:death on curing protein
VKEPVWLLKQLVLACHAEAMQDHGGSDGVRDAGLLDSALARPRHLFAYEDADLCRLAASYAHGIAKNHPFVDGNKRAAFLAAAVFLVVNGLEFTALPAHAAVFVQALAAGEIAEAEFAAWLRDTTKRARKKPAAKRATGRRKTKK